jgi:hypothetical protein
MKNKTLNRNNDFNRIRFKYVFSVLIALIYIIYSLSGFTAANSIYISFAMFSIWILVALITDPNSFISMFNQRKFICFIIYILFYFATGFYIAGLFAIGKYIGVAIILFSPMFILGFYLKAQQIKIIKLLLILSSSWFLVILIGNLIFYAQNPNAARKLASNSLAYGDVSLGGGYALAYAATILAVYLFDLWLNNVIKKGKLRNLLIPIIILLAFLVIETRSTLTILILFIGLIMSIILKRSKVVLDNKYLRRLFPRQVVVMLMLLFAVVLFFSYYQQIGYFIMDKTANSTDIFGKRIYEIGTSLTYGSNSAYGVEDLSGRLVRPIMSLNSFFKSPFIGTGYKYGYDFTLSKQYLGNHCEWADALGSMGILRRDSISFNFLFCNKRRAKVDANDYAFNICNCTFFTWCI